MQNQLIAPPQVPIASTKPTAANEFKPLFLGSTPVDEMLRKHQVPKGSLLHFDHIGDPDLHLLGLCRAAIGRGESVAFLYVPSPGHARHANDWKNLREPNPNSGPMSPGIRAYDLKDFIDKDDPTDTTDLTSPFCYFVALTPEELESDLNAVLDLGRDGEPTGDDLIVPDLIVVYGLDRLFAVEGLSEEGVCSRLERLRKWISTYSARCAQTGMTLWFGRSLDFYTEYASPMMQGMNALLYEHCPFGLAVDTQAPETYTPTCADYRNKANATIQKEGQVVNTPGEPKAWLISLYKEDTLVETLRLTYTTGDTLGEHFLDGGPMAEDVAAFYRAKPLELISSGPLPSQTV